MLTGSSSAALTCSLPGRRHKSPGIWEIPERITDNSNSSARPTWPAGIPRNVPSVSKTLRTVLKTGERFPVPCCIPPNRRRFCSTSRTSSMEPYRLPGSFCVQVKIICSMPAEMSGYCSLTGYMPRGPRGASPVIIKNNTAPKA